MCDSAQPAELPQLVEPCLERVLPCFEERLNLANANTFNPFCAALEEGNTLETKIPHPNSLPAKEMSWFTNSPLL